MKYMIVRWTGESYEILHYSHQFDDMYNQYERFKKLYDDIIMMTDVRMVHLYEGMIKIREVQEMLKKKKLEQNEKLSAS